MPRQTEPLRSGLDHVSYRFELGIVIGIAVFFLFVLGLIIAGVTVGNYFELSCR